MFNWPKGHKKEHSLIDRIVHSTEDFFADQKLLDQIILNINSEKYYINNFNIIRSEGQISNDVDLISIEFSNFI